MTKSIGSLEQVLRARAERELRSDMETAKEALITLLTQVTIGKGWSGGGDVALVCTRIMYSQWSGGGDDKEVWAAFKEKCVVARTAALSKELVEAIDRVRDLEDEVRGLTG